jgi:hypothetical protein
MKKIINPITQKTVYGSYTPVSFGQNSNRYDMYKSDSTGEETTESVLCLDKNDLSPVQIGDATVKMRENCHCCFTGYAHTVALCNKRNNL